MTHLPRTSPDVQKKPNSSDTGLHRTITWKGAFWVASGTPALVLFSIGTIAATVGTPSWLVWSISVSLGLLQAFTFAEIAGLYPNKSGGTSVYGAMAWIPYSKLIAPISVWCNWLAWSPVLTVGSGLSAAYLLTAMFPEDSAVNTWSLRLLDLGIIQDGLELRVSAQFLVAVVVLLAVFAVQHRGILDAAHFQMVIGTAVLLPLLIIGVVPLLTGDVLANNFAPFVPLSGAWDQDGWSLFAAGLFIAGWSAYGFETAVCYTREFKNPGKDTVRAIFAAGLVCLLMYTIVPVTFQGALGVGELTKPGIVDGDGVGAAMSHLIGGGAIMGNLLVIMLVLALVMSIMTTMAGSSRTLYQGALDGWLPKYLARTNQHGAPTRAMWTDLVFNLGLLLLNDSVFVLATSTVCYMIFNFLNLHAGWIHRVDRPDAARPWRAPTFLIWVGAALAFVNALLLGWGANSWGTAALGTGLVAAGAIIPVFLFRHYVRDRGVLPAELSQEIGTGTTADAAHGTRKQGHTNRAGLWPYLALTGGVVMVVVGQLLAS